MSGHWHWIAAGTAAVAVVGAVLVHESPGQTSFVGHSYPTPEYRAEVGAPVTASPPLDVTTVTKPTPPPAPAQPKPTTSSPPAPPPPTSDTRTRGRPPRWTLTISIPELPVYFPDCETAWFFGFGPIKRHDPGYRDDLDKDRDGVACER